MTISVSSEFLGLSTLFAAFETSSTCACAFSTFSLRSGIEILSFVLNSENARSASD